MPPSGSVSSKRTRRPFASEGAARLAPEARARLRAEASFAGTIET